MGAPKNTLFGFACAPRWRGVLAALALALGVGGCDSIFDVDNPNALGQEDLEQPSAAGALVNGAEATVARGVADIVLAASIPTDELVWVGSYDAGRELDNGFLTNPANEFTNSESWPTLNEGRFMADLAISQLEEHDAAGNLSDRSQLARAYLYGGIVYVTIADLFDDFVFSNRREASPPVGETNMTKVYDQAITYLTKGLEIARATKKADLEAALLGMRARAHFSRALWQKLNPKGQVPANPLVNSPEAVADAQAVLTMVTPDWKYQFQYNAATVSSQIGSWINSRQEFRVDTIYGVPTTSGTRISAVALKDPIDNTPDPALQAALTELGALTTGTQLYPPLTVVSAREMHLIIAEAALASGNEAEAIAAINRVRALNNLTPFSGQIPALQMLQHERRVNLFLQGRRLADMYRFGVRDPRWLASSEAVQAPGTFFPIADEEIKSNCHLSGGC